MDESSGGTVLLSLFICLENLCQFNYTYVNEQVKDTKVAGETASVSALDFCTSSLKLAIGDQCGVVRSYYNLSLTFSKVIIV